MSARRFFVSPVLALYAASASSGALAGACLMMWVGQGTPAPVAGLLLSAFVLLVAAPGAYVFYRWEMEREDELRALRAAVHLALPSQPALPEGHRGAA